MSRKSVTILLLLAVVPLVAVVPNVGSQSFTTITNLSTVTTQATFTQASQYAVATTTVTSTISEGIYDNSFVQKGVGVFYCYIAAPISFEATEGQKVQGSIQSSSPNSLVLYILSDSQFNAWRSGKHYCDPTETGQSPLVGTTKVTSYSLDWNVPADGTYWLIIETYSAGDCVVTASVAKH